MRQLVQLVSRELALMNVKETVESHATLSEEYAQVARVEVDVPE